MSKIGIFGKSQWSREEKSLSPQISTKHAGIESSWRLHIWLEWADWLKHDWMQEQCNPIHSVFFKKPQKLAELLSLVVQVLAISCAPLNLKVQKVEHNAKHLRGGFSSVGFSCLIFFK